MISFEELKNLGYDLIPVKELNIVLDNSINIGYDFTVKDNYTFATFDGVFVQDTMGVFVPISVEAQNEVKNRMISVDNVDTFGESNFKIDKDIFVGLYTLTTIENDNPIKQLKNISEIQNLNIAQKVEISYKGMKINTTVGKLIFNENLPIEYPIINESVDKKKINKIFFDLITKNKSQFADTMNKLMRLGFKYATLEPMTLSITDMKLNKTLIDLKSQLSKEPDFNKQMKITTDMEKELSLHLKDKKSPLYNWIASGGTKGINQVRQSLVAKGLIEDASGNVLPPVLKSIGEGFNTEEYFDAASGSRKGVADRSINTAKGGYAYRKAIFCIGNVEADINNGDCGTKRTLDMKLIEEYFKRMSGRYVLDKEGKITPINESMVNSVVHLRSPIYCKSLKICRTCYGDLIKQINSKSCGILAAQSVLSISEKIMKSFHLGGAVIVKNINIIDQLMMNVDEYLRPKVESCVKQVESDLISTCDFLMVTIDTNIYKGEYAVKTRENYYDLKIGVFNLIIDKLESKCSLEYPTKLYIPSQKEDHGNGVIALIYGKGDKILSVQPQKENFSALAEKIDELISAKSPWADIPALYRKFYDNLVVIGDWDSVHLEVIISNILRAKKNPQLPARMIEPFDPITFSVKKLPSIISYPLGIAFENFSKSVQYGLISDRAKASSIERVLFGEVLNPIPVVKKGGNKTIAT